MTSAQLEQRVVNLEQELSRLKRALAKTQKSEALPWWEQIAGAFANDPIYDEAMRLGREYRESLRPKSSKRRR